MMVVGKQRVEIETGQCFLGANASEEDGAGGLAVSGPLIHEHR